MIAQRHFRGGAKRIVCEVGRKQNSEQRQIILGPNFFQGPLKEYSTWQIAWWREAIQNSVDAGATKIWCSVKRQPDGTRLVRCDDNGKGMDRNTLLTKFLALGETGKTTDSGASGGFGKAKELLLLPWIQWSVQTRTTRVVGVGLPYKLDDIAEREGTRLEVIMPADNNTSLSLAMEFVGRCNLPRTRFYFAGDSGEVVGPSAELKPGKLIREIPGKAKLYFSKGGRARLNIRSNGLWMFDRYIEQEVKGSVSVELIGRSIDLLAAHRDGFRDYDLARAIEAFTAELAADVSSATREKDKSRKVYVGTGRFSPRAAKETEAKLALASASAMDLALKMSVGSGSSVQLNTKTVDQVADVLSSDAGAGTATIEAGGIRVGNSPSAAAVVILTATPVLGQEHLERMMKQLAWAPDFYVVNNHDQWKPPPGLLPERMNRKMLFLAKAWTEICRYVLIMLNSSADYGVGWLFDKSAGAAYLREHGQHWLLLNPLSNKIELSEPFDPRTPAHLNWLVACAVHEATHMADGLDKHNEAFTSALTQNMATCAGIWTIAPLLVEAIYGGATVQQARAMVVGVGGAKTVAREVVAAEKAVTVERVEEREPLSWLETPLAATGTPRTLELSAPQRKIGRAQPQLGLKFNGRPDEFGVWDAPVIAPGATVSGLGRIDRVLFRDANAAVCLVATDRGLIRARVRRRVTRGKANARARKR